LAPFTGFYAQPWSCCPGGMSATQRLYRRFWGETNAVHFFEFEMDHQQNDFWSGFTIFTDGVPSVGRGYRSDLECCSHREMWTNIIKEDGLTRPVFSKYNKVTVRN
jgi:hypothetical protein